MDEFELIRRYFARAPAAVSACRVGIGDDAAVLQPPAGQEMAVCSDTLIAGRHFPHDTPPADIGWKALAVNLSDLAAMGAQPAGFLLNLSLPQPDPAFLTGFASGLFELAQQHECSLIGGDTTRGELSISITAYGWLPAGTAMLRGGAQPGDQICLFAPLGGAALALAQWPHSAPGVRAALLRPQPQVALGLQLRQRASACIDISDGLAADLGHLLQASGCGAQLDAQAIPLAAGLDACAPAQRWDYALHGGDEYSLCATLAAEPLRALRSEFAAPVYVIGEIESARGLRWRGADGQINCLPNHGYRHFT